MAVGVRIAIVAIMPGVVVPNAPSDMALAITGVMAVGVPIAIVTIMPTVVVSNAPSDIATAVTDMMAVGVPIAIWARRNRRRSRKHQGT